MAERTFALPDLGEGLEDAEIGAWFVKEGDTVGLNQPLVEVETAKATVEIPSPFAGTVVRVHAATGETVKVGARLVTFEIPAGAAGAEAPSEASDAATASAVLPNARTVAAASAVLPDARTMAAASAASDVASVLATPAVRRLAKDLGVDLSTLAGTGPGGRMRREDVERAAAGPVPAAPDFEVMPISIVRRTIAENLTRVVRDVPQVTTFRTVDCSALEAFRRELAVSPLPVVARGLAEVCVEHRYLNASYVSGAGEMRLHRAVNIGIATDTDRGLLVPVVRDAGSLGVAAVSEEIARLAALARQGKIQPADLLGGTITVTNTGSYGSEYGTPIITPGQGAILALGVIEPRALVVQGSVVARPACTLSLTFDHRLLDGGAAGRAFGDLVALLESRERLETLPR